MAHLPRTSAEGGDIILFARVPLPLNDAERIEWFDRPLASGLEVAGISSFLRGFTPVGRDGQVMYVGLEVSVHSIEAAAGFARRLLELGAPGDSRIGWETDLGAIEFALADAIGGNSASW